MDKQGIDYNAEELSNKVDSVNYEIKEIVDSQMQSKRDEKDEKKTSLKENINKALRKLEEEYIVQKNALKEELNGVDRTINEEYKNMEAQIIQEFAKPQADKRDNLIDLRSKAQEIEEEIQKEINEKTRFVSKFKYRIESSLDDIANEVQEELVIAETRQQAALALKKVPSALTLIQSCQSSKGVIDFMNGLTPGLALPSPEPELKKQPKDIEIIVEDKSEVTVEPILETVESVETN